MQCDQKHKHLKHKHKGIFAQWNGPSVTKPNPENCKNCSSKCAYDSAQLQYTIQHRTVLIISPLRLLPPGNHHSSDVVYSRRGKVQENKERSNEIMVDFHFSILYIFLPVCATTFTQHFLVLCDSFSKPHLLLLVTYLMLVWLVICAYILKWFVLLFGIVQCVATGMLLGVFGRVKWKYFLYL